jgi:hypothetical protein
LGAAAHHRRRELDIGFSTMKAIAGNKIFPGYLDRYLAHYGYDAQQTSEPDDPNRPHNLFGPLPQDFGAHGRFDAQARSESVQLLVTTHRAWFATALGIVLGWAGVAYTMRRWNSMQSLSDRVQTDSQRP